VWKAKASDHLATLFLRFWKGIEPDKLSLALEPEAAAIYGQSMTQQDLAPYAKATLPYTSDAYMVVDIGGGAVDITAHQVTSAVHTYTKL